ncbi:class I SAM-dependent methyltransferase [Aquipuribacter nitratireducens]|uniref:Class I SAM-dependent methyltransferase n=1 Tax=Aquipuribacter nitratireducens TaxID=650104 RepID=A0ABW0GIM7_9MICO
MSRIRAGAAAGAAVLVVVLVVLTVTGVLGAGDALVVLALAAVAGLQLWVLRRAGATYRVGSRARGDVRTLSRALAALDRRVAALAARDNATALAPRLEEVSAAVAELRLSLDSLAGATQADLRLLADDTTRLADRVESAVREAGESHAAAVERSSTDVLAAVRETREAQAGVVPAVTRQLQTEYRQVSALQQLDKLLPGGHLLHSHARGWAASPDVLLTLLEEVDRRARTGPVTVLECGSGVSTVYLAALLEQLGTGGRVVALEHEETFRDHTLEELARTEVQGSADVRLAPLERVRTPSGEEVVWYSPAAFADLHDVAVVFVDGPPELTADCARYPALPLLRDRLAPDAVLLLDDAARPAERAAVERWVEEEGALAETLPYHEKGCVRVTLGGA